jgi:hypothetical protein
MLAGARMFAQQATLESSSPEKDSTASRYNANLLDSLASDDPLQARSDLVVKKHLQARGPLVHLFQAHKVAELPRRLLHLVNPFAKTAPKPEVENAREVSPNAWTAAVGWNPGGSAFPDPVTHEASLGLFSVSGSK